MSKVSILYGVIGILIGAIITAFGAAYAVNNNHEGMMSMMGMRSGGDSQEMRDDADMTTSLEGKTGDDFDQAFLSGMIVHHQGAIDMARLAKQNAKHDEIKTLADEVIAAQTTEIADMKSWQNQWNYGTSTDKTPTHTMDGMMSH
jgi:uncharacterized protein (DUF305 family)